MALPSTGSISMSQVATELGISSTGINLNLASVRNLAGRPSGTISMSDLRGKSSSVLDPARTAGIYYKTIGTTGQQGLFMIAEGLLVSSVKFADGSSGASASNIVFSEGGSSVPGLLDIVARNSAYATVTTTATITSSSGKVARIRWTGPSGRSQVMGDPPLTFRQNVTYTEV